MSITQIAGVALLGAVVILCVRELRATFAIPVRLCVTVMLCAAAVALLVPVVTELNILFSISGAAELASVLLRALGIALICELTATFCRDLGESSIAQGVSLFGKLEILVLCIPLIHHILDVAKELLQY